MNCSLSSNYSIIIKQSMLQAKNKTFIGSQKNASNSQLSQDGQRELEANCSASPTVDNAPSECIDMKLKSEVNDFDNIVSSQLPKQAMLGKNLIIKDLFKDQASNCTNALSPIANQKRKSKLKSRKQAKEKKGKKQEIILPHAQSHQNYEQEIKIPDSQLLADKAQKTNISKSENNSKCQKQQPVNLTFETTTIAKNLGKLALKLGSRYSMPADQTTPVSKRTRRQTKKERKKSEKVQNKQKVVPIVEIEGISSDQIPTQSAKQQASQPSTKYKTQPKNEVVPETIRVLRSSSKKEKKAKSNSKRKEQQKHLNISETSSESNFRASQDVILKKDQGSFKIVMRSGKTRPKIIRQIQSIPNHPMEYVITLSNDSSKIISILELVKNYPEEFVEYLQKKLRP